MRAMTWWDHETASIWSQPWGEAISGPLTGTELTLIPANIVPWAVWLADHPDTLFMLDGQEMFFRSRQPSIEGFVIGIALGEHAVAYPFPVAAKEGVVNDHVGPFPVVVMADSETKAVHAFLRRAGDRELAFTLNNGILTDLQTGSTWEPSRGIALAGPLEGEALQQVPYITSYDWAWEDFYPHSEFYGHEG